MEGRTATIAACPGADATAFSAAACSRRSTVVRIVRPFAAPKTFTRCGGPPPSRRTTAHRTCSASASSRSTIPVR
ncbi:Uncharacterised protein [Mycobacterium tuberculosis]|nr:Uncharacterised protein [Mycobacterium tuberculosis]